MPPPPPPSPPPRGATTSSPSQRASPRPPMASGATSAQQHPAFSLPQLAVTIADASVARARIETVLLIAGWLQEHRFSLSAQTLLDEAGLQLRDDYQLRKAIRSINKHIAEGAWDSAFAQLGRCPTLHASKAVHFAMLKQQFLELVDSGDQQRAFLHLTKKIKPLEGEVARVEFHQLAYALTCKSVSEVPGFRGWSVIAGRQHLEAYLQRHCAPSTGPLGFPYVHDQALVPIRGELQHMLEDAVAFRHQVSIARAQQQQQQCHMDPHGSTAGTTTTTINSSGNPLPGALDPSGIIRVSVHSLLRDSLGGLSSVLLMRPLRRYAIANVASAHGAIASSAASADEGDTQTRGPAAASTAKLSSPVCGLASAMSSALQGTARMPRSCCLMPRQHLVLVGCTDGSIVAFPLKLTPQAGEAADSSGRSSGGAGVVLPVRHTSRVWALSAARTSPRFVSVGGTTLIVWGIAASEATGGPPEIAPIAELPHAHEVLSAIISKDGGFAVTGTKTGDLHLWDVAGAAARSSRSGGQQQQQQQHLSPRSPAADDAVALLTRHVADAQSTPGAAAAAAAPPCLNVMRFGDSAVVDLCLSNVGASLFAAYKCGTVRVIDLSVGVVTHSFASSIHSELTSIDISSSGAMLLCSFKNNTIRIWDVVCGSLLPMRLTGHHSAAVSFVRAVFARRDTAVVAGSETGEVLVWDVAAATNRVAVMADSDGHGTLPPPPEPSSSGGLGGLLPVVADDPAAALSSGGGSGSGGSDEASGGGAAALETMNMARSACKVVSYIPSVRLPLHTNAVFDVKMATDHGGLLLSCAGDGSIVLCTHDA